MKAVVLAAFAFACISVEAQIIATLRDSPRRLAGSQNTKRFCGASLGGVRGSANQTPRHTTAGNPRLVAYFDPLIDPEFKSLAENEERVVMRKGIGFSEAGKSFPRESRRQTPAGGTIAVAGILGDGSLTGDPAMLTRLLVRRANMLAAVETSLEFYCAPGRRNIPRDQLIAEFQRMVDAVRRWYLPPEQQLGQVFTNRLSAN